MGISSTNRAYCAGLYEGEGSISFITKMNRGTTPTRSIRLSISMTDLYPLELFQDFIEVGTIYGPYASFRPGNKSTYLYQVYKYKDVLHVVSNIWYWLSPRRKEQIEKTMDAYSAFILINHRNEGEMYQEYSPLSKWRSSLIEEG